MDYNPTVNNNIIKTNTATPVSIHNFPERFLRSVVTVEVMRRKIAATPETPHKNNNSAAINVTPWVLHLIHNTYPTSERLSNFL